jgi:hypothetical protein
MIPTTPAQDRHTRFSCPTPACLLCTVSVRLVLDIPTQKGYGREQGGVRATPECGRQCEETTFRRDVLLMRSLHWNIYRQTQAGICLTPG